MDHSSQTSLRLLDQEIQKGFPFSISQIGISTTDQH